ncbi:hypothetical protein D3C84_1132160 [compost metagenome]
MPLPAFHRGVDAVRGLAVQAVAIKWRNRTGSAAGADLPLAGGSGAGQRGLLVVADYREHGRGLGRGLRSVNPASGAGQYLFWSGLALAFAD